MKRSQLKNREPDDENQSDLYCDVKIPSDLSDFNSSFDSETTKIVQVKKIVDTINENDSEEVKRELSIRNASKPKMNKNSLIKYNINKENAYVSSKSKRKGASRKYILPLINASQFIKYHKDQIGTHSEIRNIRNHEKLDNKHKRNTDENRTNNYEETDNEVRRINININIHPNNHKKFIQRANALKVLKLYNKQKMDSQSIRNSLTDPYKDITQVHTSSPILQRDKDEKYNKSGLKRSVINMSSGKYQGDLIASKEYVQNSSKILASKQQISKSK